MIRLQLTDTETDVRYYNGLQMGEQITWQANRLELGHVPEGAYAVTVGVSSQLPTGDPARHPFAGMSFRAQVKVRSGEHQTAHLAQ